MKHFYKGVDISSLEQCLEEGMQVRDMDGRVTEPFALLKKYGVNSVRLRIWVNPENEPESKGYCSLEHTLRMAERIRENGMSFLLDFHSSDFWADPGHQKKPLAWAGLGRAELEQTVYEYTRNTLMEFKRQGVLPHMVQIGNEIRSGLLFPEGELPDYQGMVSLVNAGIRAARAAAGKDEMQVMIHLDQGGRYKWLHQWFDTAIACGLEDFDLIGLSYYPFWHGSFLDVKASMEQLSEKYQKPILLVETAYAWRESEKGFIDKEQIRIGGLPASPGGQKDTLEILMYLLEKLPRDRGLGIYYWEPLCIPEPGKGGWGENMGLLDEEGRVMEGITAFAMTDAERGRMPEGWPELEKKLRREAENDWEEGICKDGGENLLTNGDFSRYDDTWTMEGEEGVKLSYPEGKPGSTSRIFQVESPRNFKFRMAAEMVLPEAGRYILYMEAMGADTTGVDIRLYVEGPSDAAAEKAVHAVETVVHPVERWQGYRLEFAGEAGDRVKAGIVMASPPMVFSVRNFRLVRLREIRG